MREDFFFDPSSGDTFHAVLPLTPDHAWDYTDLKQKAPLLPKGWFELSRFSPQDRLEFVKGFWLAHLGRHTDSTQFEEHLEQFFETLETIEIVLTQEIDGHAYEPHMVYSLEGEAGFFHGSPPASERGITVLKQAFKAFILPEDYLAFFSIHNGFSKYTDKGLFTTREMPAAYQKLQKLLAEEILVRPDYEEIDPRSLIPFYESYGLHSYQCFYADWDPKGSMGNVFFSESERSLSNFLNVNRQEQNLAFSSFLDWLIYYLEDLW